MKDLYHAILILAAIVPGFAVFVAGWLIAHFWLRKTGVAVAFIGFFLMIGAYLFDHDREFREYAIAYIEVILELWRSWKR